MSVGSLKVVTLSGDNGQRGERGPAGPQGECGPIGPTGPAGPKGDIGLTGKNGKNGTNGRRGERGLRGQRGEPGLTGANGEIGPTGAQGIQGVTGPQGIQGIQGVTGLQGIQGVTGPQGLRGFRGIQGTDGKDGEDGVKGEQGVIGPTGVQGEHGDIGPTGTQGEHGPTGVQGDIGPTGTQGEHGPTGVQGDIGPTGLQGEHGDIGPTGARGEPGPTGQVIYVEPEKPSYYFEFSTLPDNLEGLVVNDSQSVYSLNPEQVSIRVDTSPELKMVTINGIITLEESSFYINSDKIPDYGVIPRYNNYIYFDLSVLKNLHGLNIPFVPSTYTINDDGDLTNFVQGHISDISIQKLKIDAHDNAVLESGETSYHYIVSSYAATRELRLEQLPVPDSNHIYERVYVVARIVNSVTPPDVINVSLPADYQYQFELQFTERIMKIIDEHVYTEVGQYQLDLPSDVTKIHILTIGGGGAGAAGGLLINNDEVEHAGAGGGGGSGVYNLEEIDCSRFVDIDCDRSLSIYVGAGGKAGLVNQQYAEHGQQSYVDVTINDISYRVSAAGGDGGITGRSDGDGGDGGAGGELRELVESTSHSLLPRTVIESVAGAGGDGGDTTGTNSINGAFLRPGQCGIGYVNGNMGYDQGHGGTGGQTYVGKIKHNNFGDGGQGGAEGQQGYNGNCGLVIIRIY